MSHLWRPAQFGLGLGGITQQLLNFSGPVELGVHL